VEILLQKYFTVSGYGEEEIIIQKSRFICYIQRVEIEADAQKFIADIKKKHWDASHNCSAYLIGENDQIQKANDDGEPSGTAGVPMLEVLKKKSLKDTVVVVTRYFGGIKLGSGGLIRAYGKAVTEGLQSTGIVERTLMRIVKLSIEYTLLGRVENELRNSVYQIKNISYTDNVDVYCYVKDSETDNFIEYATELTNGSGKINLGEYEFLENLVKI
jgi:uncharacterized YigZ family protein